MSLTYLTRTRLYVWSGGNWIAVFVVGFKHFVGRIRLHSSTESAARAAINYAEDKL